MYRDVDGKQKSKPLGKVSKRQAERELLIFSNQSSDSPITFYEFCHEYVKWHAFEYPASHNRIRQIIEQHLIPVFGGMLLQDISVADGEQYKRQRQGVVSAGTVIKEIRTLKAIINKAVEWGRVEANPITSLKPPKELRSEHPPFYTAQQLGDLYSVCNEYDAALWRFMANTGLRRGEMMNLKTMDVKENGIYVVSRDGARTKSGKFRVVPWSDGAKQASSILLQEAGDFIIDRVNARSLSRKFSKAVGRASLPGSLHWLRHTFGSHLVMAGVPMRVIQQVMGHSSVTVTERYAHLDSQFIDKQLVSLAI